MFRLNYERGAVSSTVTVGGGCVRHTMAGLVVNCVQQYLHHIVDGSPPKAEYVRHFEARSPRALGGQYVLSGGLPHSPEFAKIEARMSTEIEDSMPFLDHAVQLTVDNMVTSLVCADKPMDKVSNEELGADVHNVPADGDCMLHAWIKATESNEDLPLGFRMVTGLREGLAQYFESHSCALVVFY